MKYHTYYYARNIVRWSPSNGFTKLGHPDHDGVATEDSGYGPDCANIRVVNALLVHGDDLYIGGSFRFGTNEGLTPTKIYS